MRLSDFTLISGNHGDIRASKRGCINNVISMLVSQSVDDKPSCVCPAIREFSIRLNDACWPSDEERTRVLLPLAPLMMETADGREVERARYLAHMALRVFAPLALRAAGLREEARELRRHPTQERATAADADAYAAARAAADADAIAAADAARAAADAIAAADAADAADAAIAAYTAARAADAAIARGRVLRVAACVLKRACLLGMPTYDIERKTEASRRFADMTTDEATCLVTNKE